MDIFGERALITDTIGFIDRLPITLIESFYSTLEEITYSDLILLVVDISDPVDEVLRKITASLEILRRIGAVGIPTIMTLNKIDLLPQKALDKKVRHLSMLRTNLKFVPISALCGTNLDLLKMEMMGLLKRYKNLALMIPMTQESFSLLSWIYENTKVHKVIYGGDSLRIYLGAPQNLIEKIGRLVERLGGKVVPST